MKYDFLILGYGEINKEWLNPQWTAYTLSKEDYKVAYFNPPAYKKIRPIHFLRLLNRLLQKREKVDVKFDIFNSFLNKSLIFRFLNYFERQKISRIISQSKNIICFQPLWLEFYELPTDKTIFFICDNYSELTTATSSQLKFDKIVSKNYSKIIITNELLKSKHPNAIFEPNCISKDQFNFDVEKTIKNKKRYQACFVGSITKQKTDIELIKKLLIQNPKIDFCFAGKIVDVSIDDLLLIKNFKYLGELNYHEATKLMKESTYGLIPLLNNKLTANVSSMKYFEYLASLLIPVCTKSPMFLSLPNELRPSLYLNEEIKIQKFKLKNLIALRELVIKSYSYTARISRIKEKGYL